MNNWSFSLLRFSGAAALALAVTFIGGRAMAAPIQKCVSKTNLQCVSTIGAAINDSPKRKKVIITIDAGVYNENIAIPQGGNMTLSGAGPLTTTLNGVPGGKSVVTVFKGANATLEGMTISGGSAPQGGGISSAGVLALIDLVLSHNTATGGANQGGGLYFNGNSLKIANVKIVDNSADIGAGVFLARGVTKMNSSTVESNLAKDAAGGIAIAGGSAKLVNVSINLNQATLSHGGGVQVSGGKLNAQNTSIINNIAGDSGGGAALVGLGALFLNNSSIAGNQAPDGGGVVNQGSSANAFKIANTLIGDNSLALLSMGQNPDCLGQIRSLGFNLVQTLSGACSFTNAKGDKIPANSGLPVSNPLLDPLTLVCDTVNAPTSCALPISPSSAMIDGGNPAVPNGIGNHCLPADPLGTARPKGHCDIGAFEVPNL